MKFASLMRVLCLCLTTVALAVSASAQTYTEIVSFNGNSAAGPKTPLTQGLDGNLYGTTYYGGTGTCFDGDGIGCGVVFTIVNGKLGIVYNFQQSGLTYPGNSLLMAVDGNFYGTSPTGTGAIFKITPTGTLSTLYQFDGSSQGYGLGGGVIQGADGNFYGTTEEGGATSAFCPAGCGTVFKLTPKGVLSTVYSFCPQNYCSDGEYPAGSLVQGPDGNFYGTTTSGGLYKKGTIFRVSSQGVFKLLYTFLGTIYSVAPGLILGSDGNFYGATYSYGFQITRSGVFTELGSLSDNGDAPHSVIQGNDGNLYGTTPGGGNFYFGEIFEMPTYGTSETTLYSFSGYPSNGSYPFAGLVQTTNGTFYGTTYSGGSSSCNFDSAGCGTIFSYDAGLAPFVSFVRGMARIGQTFLVLGQGFTGATSVTLNGTPATFTVKADTALVVTVPAGATTGYVTVDTTSGTLTSNAPFYVLK
jgi:uncharacterized repeat protein (TIGR03803 family)